MDARRMRVTVRPRTVLRVCVVVSAVLLLVDLAIAFAVADGLSRAALIPRLFDTDYEANLPAWWSSMLFAGGALAAFAAAQQRREDGSGWASRWTALGVLLVVLSIDEAAVLHEQTVGPLGDVAEAAGLSGDAARLGAVAIAGLGLAVLAIPFTRWLHALPRFGQVGMLTGVFLLVGSAFGLEVVARLLEQWRGFYGLADDLLSSAEEFGEMLGATALLVTALALTGLPASGFADPEPAPEPAAALVS
ncbi:MAG: hypothetical protein JHC95_18450 [Solirubrobacteraceae bacterium]|nr:hypothetical protein [Solirubrobacteraceae bacterium]